MPPTTIPCEALAPQPSALEHYRERVAGTTIDPQSLLSTDYFNHFNTVIMLLGMLPESPELLDEIDGWEFKSYKEHFEASGLDFGPLAIEAYPFVPVALRERFEKLIDSIHAYIEASRSELRALLKAGEIIKFADAARTMSKELQRMIDSGSAIVHGQSATLDQSAIDQLF